MRQTGEVFLKPLTAVVLIAVGCLTFCGKHKAPTAPPLTAAKSRIFEPDGVTGAVGATVKYYVAGSSDTTPAATSTTDIHGVYLIPELPDGFYSTWVELDSLSAFRDSIEISSLTQSTTIDDTLTCGGTVTGQILLYSCHDPRTVTVRIPGSDKCAAVDGLSKFTLRNLPGGTHTLLFTSSIADYSPAADTVTIIPCTVDTLPVPVRLPYNNIPMVTNLSVHQDTVSGIVTLSWNAVKQPSMQDYVIYRDQCTNFNFSDKIIFATTDTFIIDSSGQPEAGSPWGSRCIEYRVAVRTDLQETGSICKGKQITLVPRDYITTLFSHKIRYSDPDTSVKYATVNDYVALIGYAFNPTRLLTSMIWFDPAKHDTIFRQDSRGVATNEFYHEIAYTFDMVGSNQLYFIVTDNAGITWCDTLTVNIIADSPKADAGNDTGVLAGSTVHFHGNARQLFGRISRWEWKIGDGSWTQCTGADSEFIVPSTAPGRTWTKSIGPVFEFIAPSAQTTTICSLAVTDDDGNRSIDGLHLITSNKASDVVASVSHSLILKEDGIVLAFGNNTFGQLGNSTTTEQLLPEAIMSDVIAIAAGESYSLLLHRDGTVWTCGSNESGQLGDGTIQSTYSLIPGLTRVTNVAAGKSHSLFLKADSTAWACGWNMFGQLGDSTQIDRMTPQQVLTGVKSIATGTFHSLFLKYDGSVWACGENGGGQLGDGTITDRLTPVKVLDDVQRIAAGSWHSFFLKNNGTLWACGNNGYGQLGDGTLERRPTPVLVMAGVRNMATAMYHSMILLDNGTLLFCGRNPVELTVESPATAHQFRPYPFMAGVRSMATGVLYSLILKTDGTVWACGVNERGQLGDGTYLTRLDPVCIHPPQRVNWGTEP